MNRAKYSRRQPPLTLTLGACLAMMITATPLAAEQTKPTTPTVAPAPAKLKVFTSIEAARKEAAQEKKPILMVFTATGWCPHCKKLEADILSKKEFKEWAAKTFILYVCDLKMSQKPTTSEAKKLLAQYKVRGYPSMILTDSEGTVTLPKVYAPRNDPTVSGLISCYELMQRRAAAGLPNPGDNN